MRIQHHALEWAFFEIFVWGLLSPILAQTPDVPQTNSSDASPRVVSRLGSARFDVSGEVASVAWSSDGGFLATSAQAGRGFGTTHLSLWNAKTGERVWQHNSPSPRPEPIAFSHDGKTIFEMGPRGHSVFDVTTGNRTDGMVPGVLLERNGLKVLCGENLQQIILERGQEDKQRVTITIEGDNNGILSVQVSPDGQWLATGSSAGQLIMWDVQNGKRIREFDVPKNRVSAVDFTPDGKLLVASGNLNGIHVFGAETGKRRSLLSGNARREVVFALDPKGKRLVSSEKSSRSVQIWNLESGDLEREINHPMDAVNAIAFSPDGTQVALTGREGFSSGRLGVWNVASGEEQSLDEPGHSRPVTKLAFSPDSQLLATASFDQTICLWKVKTAQLFTILQGDASHDLRFSPDAWILGAAGREGSYRLWEVSSADLLVGQDRVLSLASHDVESRFSPNLDRLAMGSRDGEVRIIETATGKQLPGLKIFEKHEVGAVAFSADGNWLAVGSGSIRAQDASQDKVVIWDLAKGKKLRELVNPILPNDLSRYEKFENLEFAPDGNVLASVHSKQGLVFWDAAFETSTQSVPIQRGGLVTFSSDGRILIRLNTPRTGVRGFASSQVELMETATGEVFQTIAMQNPISSLALSPDGLLLAAALANSRQVLLWDLEPLVPKQSPTEADLEKAVDRLLLQNARQGRDAMATLIAAGDRSIVLLARHLKPVDQPLEADQTIQRLIQDLDSDDFFTREKASKEIIVLGPSVVSALKTELEKPRSLEVARRIEALLKQLNSPLKKFSGESLRRIRAIEVLEKIGTSRAEDVLKRTAKGPASSREANDARFALKRIQTLKAGR